MARATPQASLAEAAPAETQAAAPAAAESAAAAAAEPAAAAAADPVAAVEIDRTNPPPGSVPPGGGFYRWDAVAGWVEIQPEEAQRPKE